MINQGENKIKRTFEEAFISVQQGIDKVLVQSPKLIQPYISYLSESKGKLLRSQLLLSAAMQEGEIHQDAIALGISIELLHLATLIHDDIIDQSDTRRSLPTIYKKYGSKYAVLSGDYLLAKSLEVLSTVSNKNEYAKRDITVPNYMSKLVLGEILQHNHQGDLDLGIREYLKIIQGKTATLFEAACYTGASLITEDEDILKSYRSFGRQLGIIFQISDDILDYESHKKSVGKEVESDYMRGVITLPLIYALKKNPNAKEKIKSDKSFQVIDFVRKSGGTIFAKKFSKKYYDKAMQTLIELQLDDKKYSQLQKYLHIAYEGRL